MSKQKISRIIVSIITIIITSSISFAGGSKLYTDDDLDNYKFPSDSKIDNKINYPNTYLQERISWFDLKDIEDKIFQLKKEFEKSKNNEMKEISARCISGAIIPHPRFEDVAIFIDDPASEAACETSINLKYERIRDKISEQIYLLEKKYNELKKLYEIQEELERRK